MAPRKIDFDNFELDAQRDPLDFRDRMYVPTLVEVPLRIDLDVYKSAVVPILDQGSEGACTGFGLATVVHYLLRTRQVDKDEKSVSPRMLYEMAKRYDEWPGEKYSGSSARGAMKGWHKHGVCRDELWPYVAKKEDPLLTLERALDARDVPLGAYFRVNHKDLVAMHAAIAEVKILYATALVHEGWNKIKSDGTIPFDNEFDIKGGHAFAIVAYDHDGFWIQNSWSADWGLDGFAKISYDDWLENGMDVWVARLGVPIKHLSEQGAATGRAPGAKQSIAYTTSELLPHVISLGNDGRLQDRGTYGTTKDSIQRIVNHDFQEITADWTKKRLLLYAHGGLVGEKGFLQRVAEYRSGFFKAEVYPLAYIWHTDLWSTVTNILKDAVDLRRPEGFLEDTLDFMLDRLDDTIEAIVRGLRVRELWDEMKENARLATNDKEGGARISANIIAEMLENNPDVELHMAGHSAGSIFLAPLVNFITKDLGKKITSCTLWAPGITVSEFRSTYMPAIQDKSIERFSLYTLNDKEENDDHCSHIYHKSLLYLVSNALEPTYQEKILGMEKFILEDGAEDIQGLFDLEHVNWIKAPKDSPRTRASSARHHGAFDDDVRTVMSTLATIIHPNPLPREDLFEFKRSSSSLGDIRRQLG
ncbi:MAG: C1 family peptidase [Anaerolineales bacterium]|jgi:hypothetical protein